MQAAVRERIICTCFPLCPSFTFSIIRSTVFFSVQHSERCKNMLSLQYTISRLVHIKLHTVAFTSNIFLYPFVVSTLGSGAWTSGLLCLGHAVECNRGHDGLLVELMKKCRFPILWAKETEIWYEWSMKDLLQDFACQVYDLVRMQGEEEGGEEGRKEGKEER